MAEECNSCGFPRLDQMASACPKCDEPYGAQQAKRGLLEVDIAHAGESWEQAKAKIDRSLDQALDRGHAGLKIIHGYGSSTSGQSIIGPQAKAYLKHLADWHGGRYTSDRQTPGASLIWLNR